MRAIPFSMGTRTLALAAKGWGVLGLGQGPAALPAFALLAILFATAAGVLTYLLLERPIIGLLKRGSTSGRNQGGSRELKAELR